MNIKHFPMTVSLPGRNGAVTFEKASDVQPWLINEANFAEYLSDHLGRKSPGLDTVGRYVHSTGDLDESSDRWLPFPAELAAAYSKLVRKDSVDGRFVQELMNQYPGRQSVAAGAWGYLAGVASAFNDDAILQGAMLAIRHLFTSSNAISDQVAKVGTMAVMAEQRAEQIIERSAAMSQRFQEFERSAADKISHAEAEVSRLSAATQQAVQQQSASTQLELSTALEKFHHDQAVALENAAIRSDAIIGQAQSSAQRALSEVEERTNAIVETFQRKMELEAPVAYWTEKSRAHFWLAIAWGVVFAVALVLGGCLFASFAAKTFPAPVQSASAAPAGGQPAAPVWSLATIDLGHVATTIVTVTLGIWLLRIVARIFLSNLHIYLDCNEKKVMTLAYLALRARGSFAGSEGEKIMLERIFRTSGTGIAREDGNPTHFLQDVVRSAKS